MIKSIPALAKKIEQLEKEIENLKTNTKYDFPTTNCVCINKRFSNLEIILSKKILISTLSVGQGLGLFFQGQIELFLPLAEEVEFSIIINNISIQKETKNLNAGNNNVSIFCNFIPISSEKTSIFIKITPKNQKPVYLQNISLLIWGMIDYEEDVTYQMLELKNKYLISFLYNNNIYYKFCDKKVSEFCFNDFELNEIAGGYSFTNFENEDTVYLFRINLNGDLFFSKLGGSETYLLSNISNVSAISLNGKHHVFCISNFKCLYFEIDESGNTSDVKNILTYSFKLKSVYAYFNKITDKILVVLTDLNNSNFLVEQIDDGSNYHENISASYKISINTYEAI